MCEETARPRGRVCEESRVVALMIFIHVLEFSNFNICVV